MKTRQFFKKIFSPIVVLNLAGLALALVALIVGVYYGLGAYTRHGEQVKVPDLSGCSFSDAAIILRQRGLQVAVSDTGYNRRLPADRVLSQNPMPGIEVKPGRTVYLMVNASGSPTLTLPDVVDNSSEREATARLRSMGFTLLDPQYIEGEKEWVYGVTSAGRHLYNGQKVSADAPLRLVVGSGRIDLPDTEGDEQYEVLDETPTDEEDPFEPVD